MAEKNEDIPMIRRFSYTASLKHGPQGQNEQISHNRDEQLESKQQERKSYATINMDNFAFNSSQDDILGR